MTKIDVIIYSYKGKNLKEIVDIVNKNTRNEVFIHLYDQSNIDKTDKFSSSNIDYVHIFWDHQQGGCYYKKDGIEKSTGDFILIISDDIILSDGWDDSLIKFIEAKDDTVFLSGSGRLELSQKDLFSFRSSYSNSDIFLYSNWIDRNFIFAKREAWESVGYPSHIKYNGENEDLSMSVWAKGYQICSTPSGTYQDLGVRTIESLYTPYSTDHNYNLVINRLKSNTMAKFCKFHGILQDRLFPLPYYNNDVAYDPAKMEFNEVDARKFIAITRAIY